MRQTISSLDMKILDTIASIEDTIEEGVDSHEEDKLEEFLEDLESLRSKITDFQQFKGWIE